MHILLSESDYASSVDLESLLTNNFNDHFHIIFKHASFLLLIVNFPFFWRHLFDIFFSLTELRHQATLFLAKQFFLGGFGHNFIGVLISCYGLLLLSSQFLRFVVSLRCNLVGDSLSFVGIITRILLESLILLFVRHRLAFTRNLLLVLLHLAIFTLLLVDEGLFLDVLVGSEWFYVLPVLLIGAGHGLVDESVCDGLIHRNSILLWGLSVTNLLVSSWCI